MENREIKVGQSVFDIALQERGELKAAFEIAEQNGISVTDELMAGKVLQLERDSNHQVVSEYQSEGIFPATALEKGLLPEGIGYMGIEIDFMVS